MSARISWIGAVVVGLPVAALGQDYDFQDTATAIHFVDPLPYDGPGVLASSHAWTGFLFPGTYSNDGVTLNLSGFPGFAVPDYIVNGPPPYLGTPAFVLSQSIQDEEAVSFSLGDIPAAPVGDTYDLVLYSTNFAADGGTAFALGGASASAVANGFPDRGISHTINSPATGVPNDSFVEGVNYVQFDHVVPVGGSMTVVAVPLRGEVDLNAVQLVAVPLEKVPPPPAVGDCNVDGAVNLTDLLTLLNDYGQTGMDWAEGDFNGDGTVNLTDLLALLNNYGMSDGGGVGPPTGTRVVPEPVGGAVILAGMFGVMSRRSRQVAF